jgi:hypothetical protein
MATVHGDGNLFVASGGTRLNGEVLPEHLADAEGAWDRELENEERIELESGWMRAPQDLPFARSSRRQLPPSVREFLFPFGTHP